MHEIFVQLSVPHKVFVQKWAQKQKHLPPSQTELVTLSGRIWYFILSYVNHASGREGRVLNVRMHHL
jgi:hypothetical protein